MSFYQVQQVDDRTWRIIDPLQVYMYLLEGEKKALLIDAGIGFAGLKKTVKMLTKKPVQLVNTHGHLDHIGADVQFDSAYIAAADADILREHSSRSFKRAVIPEFTAGAQVGAGHPLVRKIINLPGQENLTYIEDGDIFDLGGRRLEVIAVPGHTPGSICLLDAENKQLFSGDTVCAMGVLLFFDHSMPVETFLDSLKRLYARKDQFCGIYPGHHEVPIDVSYIKEYMDCAGLILENTIDSEPIQNGLGHGLLAAYKRISIAYREKYKPE